MEKVRVNLADRSYDILISGGWLDELGRHLRGIVPSEKILVVTDSRVGKLYADKTVESLRKEDFPTDIITLPEGEENKTLDTVERIYNFLADNNFPRRATLVALGGGVVGDITGFAAATYMRGVNFVQIPTSLLAMVDSSVGGKTGVNHPLGKNLIGAFYQPKFVFIDTSLLKTLAPEEFYAGMAEVIKYGMIKNEAFFEFLSDEMDALVSGDMKSINTIIKRCCEIKAEVVSEDEREAGIRAILNFGHTVGHAIEALTNYHKYRHGEAVAIGMIAASQIAIKMGMLSEMEVQRLWQVVSRAKLPYRLLELDPIDIVERMKKDKKVRSEKIRFVLPRQIGETVIRDDVSEQIMIDVLNDIRD